MNKDEDKKTWTYKNQAKSDKVFCIFLMTFFLLWNSFTDLAYNFTVKIAPPCQKITIDSFF